MQINTSFIEALVALVTIGGGKKMILSMPMLMGLGMGDGVGNAMGNTMGRPGNFGASLASFFLFVMMGMVAWEDIKRQEVARFWLLLLYAASLFVKRTLVGSAFSWSQELNALGLGISAYGVFLGCLVIGEKVRKKFLLGGADLWPIVTFSCLFDFYDFILIYFWASLISIPFLLLEPCKARKDPAMKAINIHTNLRIPFLPFLFVTAMMRYVRKWLGAF